MFCVGIRVPAEIEHARVSRTESVSQRAQKPPKTSGGFRFLDLAPRDSAGPLRSQNRVNRLNRLNARISD